MGILDLFRKSNASPVEKHATKAVIKLSQAPERMAAIRALAELKSSAAVAAILPRFTFHIDPNNWDQQEKEEAFKLVTDLGLLAVEPTIAFIKKNNAVTWPLKILGAVDSDNLVDHLLTLLSDMDTEYDRNPERKIQILQALEGKIDARIPTALLRFLDDANENARLHTAGSMVGQTLNAEAAAIVSHAAKESSSRVRVRLLEALASSKVALAPLCAGTEHASSLKALRNKLPNGYAITVDGIVQIPQ